MITIAHKMGCFKGWSLILDTCTIHHLDYIECVPARILFHHYKPCGACAGRFERAKSTMTGRIYRDVIKAEIVAIAEETEG